MNKNSRSPTKQPLSRKTRLVIGASVLALIILWLVFTVAIPLVRGEGADKYQGLQKSMAETMVNLTQLQNGPPSPSLTPDFMYNVRIEDIHPTSKDEAAKYCSNSHPSYFSDDPSQGRYYTIEVSEQWLFTPSIKKTVYAGCSAGDYIHSQIFGIPEEVDTRQHREYQ